MFSRFLPVWVINTVRYSRKMRSVNRLLDVGLCISIDTRLKPYGTSRDSTVQMWLGQMESCTHLSGIPCHLCKGTKVDATILHLTRECNWQHACVCARTEPIVLQLPKYTDSSSLPRASRLYWGYKTGVWKDKQRICARVIGLRLPRSTYLSDYWSV